MTKEELQSVLKIPPRCIYIGKDAGWKVSDFLVDCSGYIGSINLDSLEMLKCSIAFNECKFVGKIVEKNKTYQYAFIFRQCSFQEFRLFDCLLEEEIKFDSCIFAQGVVFSDSGLNKKVCFSNCRFEYEAMFVRTKFMEASSFVRSISENNAIFYGAEFNKLVSFNQAIFKGEASFVNVAMDFDFSDLKNIVIEMANLAAADKKIMANDYRDSFRLIKNNLLKNNNTLDASQYHKMELYCKEIELESKEQKRPSDWLEKWQLWFYRKTSDHHTDLLKIIAWVLVWVGLCGLALFAYRYGGRLPLQPKSGSLLGVFQKSYGWFYEFLSAHHVGYVALFLLLGFLLASLLLRFVGRGLLCARYCKYLSFTLGTVYSLCVAIQNPKYILGVANFSTLADSDWVENIILLFYTIGMIILLFSLQKTARKNTIIPS